MYQILAKNVSANFWWTAPHRPKPFQTSVRAPVRTQGLHTERVQAMPIVRWRHGRRVRRCVATLMLGPVDVTAGWRARVIRGRGGGRRGGRGGGGGGSTRRGAARGEGVCPPVPARCAPQAAVGAVTGALMLPRVVARLRHRPSLLPPGVSEIHFLDTACCPKAVVVWPQGAEVVSGNPLLQTRHHYMASRRV